MGYYSSVAICIKKEDYEVLKEKSSKLDYDIVENADTARFDDDAGVVVVSWGCTKWYEEFPEVKLVENFIYDLDIQNKPYQYVRIGEDITDTEERCGNWCDGVCNKIHVLRDIEFDI